MNENIKNMMANKNVKNLITGEKTERFIMIVGGYFAGILGVLALSKLKSWLEDYFYPRPKDIIKNRRG